MAMLMSGKRIKRTDGKTFRAAPDMSKPNGTSGRDGISTPTHTIKPRLSSNPLIHRKRAMELCQAWVMTNDG